ncbi:Rid family hydrolase [Sporosarcina aquimarina]|nr:Rid family hydrolase [Sporosarcina aquimarina]
MDVLTSKFAPTAVGPYSQAIDFNRVIYLSGMLPINPNVTEIN